MNVSHAMSLFGAASGSARARRSFMERIAARLGRGRTFAYTFASVPKVVDIETTRHLSTEHAQDDFECDVMPVKAEIAFAAGYRQVKGAGLTRFPAQVIVTQPALTRTTLHARHRPVRVRQDTQIRIHAIEAQFDLPQGTKRLQLDVRLACVRQQFGECTSKLNAVWGPVDGLTRYEEPRHADANARHRISRHRVHRARKIPALLSVGIVLGASDEREFYAEVTDADRLGAAAPFTARTVLPQFGRMEGAACAYLELVVRLRVFLLGLATLREPGNRMDVAFNSDIDWMLVQQALRDGDLALPRIAHFFKPVNVYNIDGFAAGEVAANNYFATQASALIHRHHALCDARALRIAYAAASTAALSAGVPRRLRRI